MVYEKKPRDDQWKTELTTSPLKDLWIPETSLFETLMAKVSDRIDHREKAMSAILAVLYKKLDEEEKEQPAGEESLPGAQLDILSAAAVDDITELRIASIPVKRFLKEATDMIYKMRTKPGPGAPSHFSGSAYNYMSAICTMGIYAGICTLEKNAKNREALVAARCYEPKVFEEEMPQITGPDPFKWVNLHDNYLGEQGMPIWCGINRVKDRVKRLADDYGLTQTFIAQVCFAIIMSNMKCWESLDVIRAQKEVKRLYKWFSLFNVVNL